MKKERNEEKQTIIEKARIRKEKFSIFVSFLGALFFIATVLLKLKKNTESQLYPFIVGFSIAYVLVFIIFLIAHRKNSKQIKKDTADFKFGFKIFKLLMNLLFIGSSILIFIESLKSVEAEGLIAKIEVGFSGLLLFIKLISTLGKLVKSIKKKAKKEQKEKNKKE